MRPTWGLLFGVPLLVHALSLPVDVPALTQPPSLHRRHPELSYVHELNNSAGYIRFAVPSLRHSEGADEASYIFELRVHPTPERCGITNLELNDRSLSSQWNGPNAYGQDYLSVDSVNNQHQDRLNFSWQVSCLHSKPDPYQVLTVAIGSTHVADLGGLDPVPGFTISFDHRRPEIILLSPTPDINAHSSDNAHRWQDPAPDARLPLAILPVGDRTTDVSSLTQEVKKLRLLPIDSAKFREVVRGQKSIVAALFREEFQKAKKEIKQCESINCMVRTTYQKTKAALDVACLRYGPRPKSTFKRSDPNCPSLVTKLQAVKPNGASQSRIAMIQEFPVHCEHDHKELFEEDNHDVKIDYNYEELPSHIVQAYEEFHSEVASYGVSESWVTDSFSSDASGSDPYEIFDEYKIEIAIGIVASLICLGCLASLLHRHCCSPRARADRLARREERKTRRQYRCLARKQALRDWWNRYGFGRRSQVPTDYEEKRALILAQEDILETAMQRNIERLRYPQRLAASNVTAAEEGLMYPPSDDDESSPLSRSNSLPGYRSRASSGRPPSYKEHDEYSNAVITDGFLRYTPSGTIFAPDGTDVSPDSSVVEISPRHSSETLRTEFNMV